MTPQRHFFRLTALFSAFAFLAACGNDGGYVTETGAPPYTEPVVVDPTYNHTAGTPPPEPAPPPSTNTGKPWSPPSQNPAPAPSPNASKYPKAQPIPGKPGLVKSPFAPYAGEVDVSGLKSGQAAKCPYTGKIFIVP
jgi:hypothetical protein